MVLLYAEQISITACLRSEVNNYYLQRQLYCRNLQRCNEKYATCYGYGIIRMGEYRITSHTIF